MKHKPKIGRWHLCQARVRARGARRRARAYASSFVRVVTNGKVLLIFSDILQRAEVHDHRLDALRYITATIKDKQSFERYVTHIDSVAPGSTVGGV